MSLSPYLYFEGECNLAFEFYCRAFAGEISFMQQYSDGPAELDFPEEDKNRVMHATLKIGDFQLQGADLPSNVPNELIRGNNFSISYFPKSKDEAERVFEALAENGTITMPLQNTFWGSFFGTCTDQFGVQWIINFSTEDSRHAET